MNKSRYLGYFSFALGSAFDTLRFNNMLGGVSQWYYLGNFNSVLVIVLFLIQVAVTIAADFREAEVFRKS